MDDLCGDILLCITIRAGSAGVLLADHVSTLGDRKFMWARVAYFFSMPCAAARCANFSLRTLADCQILQRLGFVDALPSFQGRATPHAGQVRALPL